MRVGPGDSANPTRVENPRAEVARVLRGSAISSGEITTEDRDYVARIIATEAKFPQEEARRRVDTGIEQAKQSATQLARLRSALPSSLVRQQSKAAENATRMFGDRVVATTGRGAGPMTSSA